MVAMPSQNRDVYLESAHQGRMVVHTDRVMQSPAAVLSYRVHRNWVLSGLRSNSSIWVLFVSIFLSLLVSRSALRSLEKLRESLSQIFQMPDLVLGRWLLRDRRVILHQVSRGPTQLLGFYTVVVVVICRNGQRGFDTNTIMGRFASPTK